MSVGESITFVQLLRCANLDSYCREHGWVPIANDFCHVYRRPYFTEIQFYKALQVLDANIQRWGLTMAQQEGVRKLWCIMGDLAEQFWKAFDMEIEDGRTVYADCADNLELRGREPCVCLWEHWCVNLNL